ncbi:MAG: hypothetical protein ABI286_13120 [Edaphobacter sp.]
MEEKTKHKVVRYLFVCSLVLLVAVVIGIRLSERPAPQTPAKIVDGPDYLTAMQPQKSWTTVPVVGCESGGQAENLPAPHGAPKSLLIEAKAAQKLAYYETDENFGVLAPRGWFCFGTYGSNGNSLFVSPEPINSSILFSDKQKGFAGPLVQLSHSLGDTSGRFEVARTIARVFPAHQDFVSHVVSEGIEDATSFPSGPYPKDQLTYKDNEVVEYQTPALTDGLGTHSYLLKGDRPISGVVMLLIGEDTDVLQLSVRLPPNQTDLTANIIQQIEKEAASQPKSTPAPDIASQPPLQEVKAEESVQVSALKLYADYQRNELAADNLYKGKLLSVQGSVDGIRKDFLGEPYLLLATPNEFMDVHANLVNDAEQPAAALAKGDSVTVLCRGGGMVLGSPMLLNCSLTK